MNAALRLLGNRSGEIVQAKTRDGRTFYVDLHSSPGMYDTVYFLGEYEQFISGIVSRILRPGDVCLDVGANYGWYTTLMRRLCGSGGEVHAFEPVPWIFDRLRKNFQLAGSPGNIHLNNVGVTDASGETVMHVFSGLPHGHSSMSDMGRSDYSCVKCSSITLDSYLQERQCRQVHFVKCDVEGAEMKVFMGAQSLFRQDVPPIWIIEMAKATTMGFGYRINDLLTYMKERSDYEFYAIDETRPALVLFSEFAEEDIGANVLCMPAKHYRDRMAVLEPLLSAWKAKYE